MNEIAGRRVGQYQLTRFVARGDSAYVYQGFQPGMNRFVAIKMLPPSLARDPLAVRDFQRQAELMAQLAHPAILPVYDYGQQDNLVYSVARYLEAGTVKDHLVEFADLNRSRRLLEKVCQALDYAHERGYLHGNLKPNNILLDEQGDPLLADFDFPQQSQKTAPGNAYTSPEQAAGAAIDRRADVYGLGVLLYEMVTGTTPAAGIGLDPGGQRPDLPLEVEKVILKATAEYPEQRFATAGGFYQALDEALERPAVPGAGPVKAEPPAPVDAPKTGPPEPPEPLVFPLPDDDKKDQNPWLLFVLAAGAFLIFVCACAVFLLVIRQLRSAAVQTPTVTAQLDLNVRAGPGIQYAVLGVFFQNQSAEATGISPDGQWWQMRYSASADGKGWVAANGVTADNTEKLPVVHPPGGSPAPLPSATLTPLPTSTATPEVATLTPSPIAPPSTFTPSVVPPTVEPPTVEPPTVEPPTAEPPTVELPTAELPTVELPTAELPTVVLTLDPYAAPATLAPQAQAVDPEAGGSSGGICGSAGLAVVTLLVVFGRPVKARARRR